MKIFLQFTLINKPYEEKLEKKGYIATLPSQT